MKKTILVALFLVLCAFAFGDIVGPTKMQSLSLDTSTTTIDVFATYGTRAAQAQLVNDSTVNMKFETNEASFTGKEGIVKPGEGLIVPIGDANRERIDTIIVTAVSGSGNEARLFVTLWQ